MINRVAVFILLLSMTQGALGDTHVSQYVQKLLQTTLSILKDQKTTPGQKIALSQDLMSKNLDSKWMSKFVLGKYRRTLSPEQIELFTTHYTEFVIKSYSKAIKFYKPTHTVKILNQSNISDDECIVKTTLNSTGMDPLKIDYAIRKFDNNEFKVFDIIAEGISLLNSNQAEFSSIISHLGFEGLVSDLKAKISSLDKDNEQSTAD